MPPGMSPRLDHMYVWYNHVHYQPPSCCMASLQHLPPYCPMVPLQCRPSGCHHGTTPASTTWLSPRHNSSVDHLAVTTAPLQRRPPGCYLGTTPVLTTWLSPQHHSSVDHLAVTLAPLQRRPLGSLHDVTLVLLPISALSLTTETTDDPGRAPICRPCLLCLLGWRTAACGGVCGNAAVVCGS